MRVAFVVLISLGLMRAAVAGDDKRIAATKALLATQVDLWRHGNGTDGIEKFAATMTADGRLARNGDWLRPDLMLAPPYNISKLAITATQIGWSGSWGWVVAEIKLTSRMYAEPAGAGDPHPQPKDEVYHWIELVVADGDSVKGKALGIYSAQPDTSLETYNSVQKLPPIESPPPVLAALADAKQLPGLLAKDAATSVLGTSDREAALGIAAARKLVAGWSKLVIQVVGTNDDHDKLFYTPVEISVGDAIVTWGRLRMKLPNNPAWYELDGFGIARKTTTGFEFVALAYAS
jgi:hypothetical protein